MEAISFNPVVILSHDQRAQLAHTMSTPGFVLIHQIMRSEVDKFVIDFINVPEADDASVLAKHKLCKAAAQFYELVSSRMSNEANQFMRDSSEGASPVDPTEGLIDMGEYAQPEGDESSGLLDDFELDPQLLEEELSSE